MGNILSSAQIGELKQFRVTTVKTASVLSIEIEKLLDEHSMRNYLSLLGKHLGAANDKVTASIFIKRYAFLAAAYLYTMTLKNGKLHIAFENVSLETNDHDELWLPNFYFRDFHIESMIENREKWRETCVNDLFNNHLNPLLDCLSRVTKVSKLILWENIAVYIFWLYETIFQKEDFTEDVKFRSKEDFQYILLQASGSLFGGYNKNPLKRYHNEHIYIEEYGKEVRPRNTCCYSYLTRSKKRCTSCPQVCSACPLVSGMQSMEVQSNE
ncbi:IucA/IucC family C-terminal-domain containing protein [Cytobacillus praedii]|uniref:IucA/IucC family C-terminal-domain containing protein n=1 Tax=Cytobacillus praedii TaxID=1742358 RepID=UPI002E1A6BF9|nr:IucA/IucC family C-terminal-domain containing protein [Cytobacillus praedii]